jgi:hypothetical protein
MAKKSISDIVIRAVVDTSGIANGLNNVGTQVGGRTWGATGGAPTGASGAQGGFVSPHGGTGAPGSAAAVAAGAALGARLGPRGGAGGGAAAAVAAQAAKEGLPPYFLAQLAPYLYGAGRNSNRIGRDYFPGGALNSILEARDISQRDRADLLQQRFDRAREQGLVRRERMTALLPGVRRGIRERSVMGRIMNQGSDLGRMNRAFGTVLGAGRFAPVAGPAIGLLGAGMLAQRIGQFGNQDMPSMWSDLSRFQGGDDRRYASLMKRDWAPAGKKAPLGFMERFFIESRRAAGGEMGLVESGLKTAGEMYQNQARVAAILVENSPFSVLRRLFFSGT